MLFMRRFYSKFPARQLAFGKEKKPKIKKSTRLQKVNMENKSGSSCAQYRSWQHCADVETDQSKRITLMSYNILAQDLLNEHMHLYLGIDHSFLSWEHRLNKLKVEILKLKPDILCLQEMQYNHIKHFMKSFDLENNFEYIFKKKTGSRSDGCAIVYNRRKFRLLDEFAVEYYKSPLSPYNRENIGLIAKLCTRETEPKTFLVATTHLLYNPKREDVRLVQINLLLSELERRSLNTDNSKRLPILLTGDFNSEPLTLPYRFITSGILRPDELPNLLRAITFSHRLKLIPAYGEENASTFQNKWIIVDYIFYTAGKTMYNIKLLSVYDLPTKSLCQDMGKIPNHTLGSDHLCQAIMFSIENPAVEIVV